MPFTLLLLLLYMTSSSSSIGDGDGDNNNGDALTDLTGNCHLGDPPFQVVVDSMQQKRVVSWNGTADDPVAACSFVTGGRNLVMTVGSIVTPDEPAIAYKSGRFFFLCCHGDFNAWRVG